MKSTNLLSVTIVLAMITTTVSATIWRVDNNVGAPADFTTI